MGPPSLTLVAAERAVALDTQATVGNPPQDWPLFTAPPSPFRGSGPYRHDFAVNFARSAAWARFASLSSLCFNGSGFLRRSLGRFPLRFSGFGRYGISQIDTAETSSDTTASIMANCRVERKIPACKLDLIALKFLR